MSDVLQGRGRSAWYIFICAMDAGAGVSRCRKRAFMLLPQQYPLIEDLGFPNGARQARERWVASARQERNKSRRSSVAAVVALTLTLSFFGMLPWLIQRVATPGRLQEHMSRNMPMGNAHLGAEYYNIGSALADGRGFSDPFVVESGPTAWMPPLLVWIQAGLITLFGGDRYWVMLAVVSLKTLLLCVCGFAVVRHGWRKSDGWIAFGVFAVFLVSEFWACFSFTHDGWLILAGVTATLFGLTHIERLASSGQLTIGKVVAWGSLGGFVALSSPVAGFTWAVATTLCLWRLAPRSLVVAAMMSIFVVTPWAVRNKVVLGRFVPIKSNVFFEFDQSLVLDSDGLLDWRTMSKHPYHAGPEQDAYIEMGEIAYLKTKQERFRSHASAHPDEFWGKIRNRLIATTLFPAGFSEFSQPSPALPLRWLLYPFPAIAVLALLIFGRPLSSLQRWAIVIYITYLIPYVVCSYYPRYGFPLFVVKILLCYWLLIKLIALVRHTRAIAVKDMSRPKFTIENSAQ